MEDCIFCKIIKKEIPSEIVYEDEEIISFNTIEPLAPIHILVVPKKHIECVGKFEEEDMHLISKIYSVINKIADEKGFRETGFKVLTNSGTGAGQTVKHTHFHVLAGKDVAKIFTA